MPIADTPFSLDPPWACPRCWGPILLSDPQCGSCSQFIKRQPYGLDFLEYDDQVDELGFSPHERANQYKSAQYTQTPLAQYFDSLGQPYGPGIHYYDALPSFVPHVEDSWVLDVGCATGRTTHEIASRRGVGVIGIDTLEAHLDTAHSMASMYGDRAFFARADAGALPIRAASINCVVLGNILDRVPDPLSVLSEAHRVVTDSGRVVVAHTADWPAKIDGLRPSVGNLAEHAGLKQLEREESEALWLLPDARNDRHLHVYRVAIQIYNR